MNKWEWKQTTATAQRKMSGDILGEVKCSGGMGCEKRKHKETQQNEKERENALNIYAWFLLHEYVKEWQWRENES